VTAFYVYGLRLMGDVECRYIGQTGKTPEVRRYALVSEGRTRVKQNRLVYPGDFWHWLADNHEQIEVFAIGKVDTRAEAVAMERAIIALVLRLGHRLFNITGVPLDQQLGRIRTRHAQKVYDIGIARAKSAAA
jgi:hypothetical protein